MFNRLKNATVNFQKTLLRSLIRVFGRFLVKSAIFEQNHQNFDGIFGQFLVDTDIYEQKHQNFDNFSAQKRLF